MTYFCSVCNKNVSNLCNSIFCDICHCWVHQKTCSGLKISQFQKLSLPNSETWFCPKCVNTQLPFPVFSDINFQNNNKDTQSPTSGVCASDSIKHLFSDLNKISNQADDENPAQFNLTTCNYYECEDFNNDPSISKLCQNFSAFHLNIASMSKHFDELNTLLSLLQCNFSIIGISETRFQRNREPILDFSIPGYCSVSTPTESSAGGVLLYVSDSFAFKPREDLSQCLYLPKFLESVFIEIIIPNKPNIIVGVIYRHPSMSLKSFNSDFLRPFSHKLSSENKQSVLLGDFNINLLDIEKDLESSSFLDILGSNLILPQIVLPTRITNASSTLIDNIFSSVSDCPNISGNICASISDHLPQFCIFGSTKSSDSGKGDVYKQKWSQFDQENFILDFLEIDWNSSFESCDYEPNLCFNTLTPKLKVFWISTYPQ